MSKHKNTKTNNETDSTFGHISHPIFAKQILPTDLGQQTKGFINAGGFSDTFLGTATLEQELGHLQGC